MTKVEQDHCRACRFGGILRTLPAVACAAAILALAAGCSTSGLGGGSSSRVRSAAEAGKLIDARREAFKIDHDAYAELGYRLDWRGFPVVQRGEHIQFFDAYDDVIVAHESAATISVLEASNGALRNSSQVASSLTRFVGNFRDGNHLIVSSDNEAAIIDLETGDILQRHELDRVVSTAPISTAGQKIYGTSIGHVYSHYLSPPVNAWAFDLGSPIDAELALVGQTVVAVSRNGRIAMLDAPTGTLVAQASIFGGCEADPVAGDGAVFFASLDQSIYAFNLEGRRMWRIRTEQPLHITPTYYAGVVYVPSDDQGLRAIDATTGTQLWNQEKVAGRVVALRDGRLLTWDGASAAAVDPATGDIISSAQLPAVEILKPDHFVDGNLYAVSSGGVVAKFKPRD